MAIWNWKTFTGISDDSFLARQWEYLDCKNVDLVENSRYVDAQLSGNNLSEIWFSINSPIIACKDSSVYPVFATANGTYIGFSTFDSSTSDGWQTGAYLVEQIGTGSLPVTYWFKNWYIRQQTYNGSGMTFNSPSPIVTYVPSGIPTASCIGVGRIYFAVANVIYVLDTAITDPRVELSQVKVTPWNSNIPIGSIIKYMFLYNDVMTVLATNWNSTVIYQLIEITTDVWKIRYYHTISGVTAIKGYGDKNNLYWFSKNAIYLSNGTSSEKVKTVWSYEGATIFATTSICDIQDSIFKIADGTTLWEYGHKKPGYWAILRRHTRRLSITAMQGDIECNYWSPKAYATRLSQFTFYDNYEIVSMPYEAENFNSKKEWTGIRIGHMLPAYSLYTNNSILCSIQVQVLTDDMEQRWITSSVNVATIVTPVTWVAERFTDITISEINTAISTAWYNPDFQYIKIKVLWNAGDPTFTTGNGTMYRKTPKFFWIELTHKEIRKWIPN